MLYALKGCILEGGGGTATNCYLKGVGVGTCIPHAVYSGRYLELYYFWRGHSMVHSILKEYLELHYRVFVSCLGIYNIYSGVLCREVLSYAVSLFWRVHYWKFHSI